LAVVVLFSTANGRAGSGTERYVVARRALTIGSRISPADVSTATLHLPAGALRGRVFNRTTQVVGAVVVAPVAAGELLQASAILAADAVADRRQISVPIESARALGDRLQPGELVDVVATFGSGADAFTAAVVKSARVIAREENGGPLGDRKGEVVVLAVDTGDDAVAIAHAIAAGQISLIRVSGVPPGSDPSGPYRAPRPGADR
jgi:Flp pilus assembly protein CpaB